MRPIGSLVCPVLVGRDDLLDHADRRLAQALGGRGGLLFLAGEAGIGKSRLLAGFEAKAQTLGFRRLRGATFPRDLEVPAAPFVDLARNDHGNLVPGLLDRLLADDAAPGDAHRRRRLLVLDVADHLRQAAGDAPLLVGLEDLHWADDLSLEIVAALARHLPEAPILAVATYRSDELYPRIPMREWRARLLTQRLAEEARLPRLDGDAVATMTGLLLGSELPVPADVVDAVRRRTDGIPLHVEELLGVVVGSATERGEAIRTARVPDTLDDAIRTRLAGRSAIAQQTARAAAVVGRSVSVEQLALVADLPVDDVAAGTAELLDHFILVEGPEVDRLDFRHALIRDAIYASIAEPERRRLHSRVVDVFAAAGEEDQGFLSTHLEIAGRRDEAHAAALAGARRAESIGSRSEAYGLYARAVRNLPDDGSPADRAAVLEAHGLAAANAGDIAAEVTSLEEARRLYLEAGLRADAARLVAELTSARYMVGWDCDRRVASLRDALGELEGLPDEPATVRARARLLSSIAGSLMLERRLEESIEYGDLALRLAVDAGLERIALRSRMIVGDDYVFAGRMDEGWALLEEVIVRARAAEHEIEAGGAAGNLASCASVLVEYELGARWAEEAADYCERVEMPGDRDYALAHLAHIRWATGRWTEAEALAARVRANAGENAIAAITAAYTLGYLAVGRGDTGRARSALDDALELSERRELQRISPVLWGFAELALLEGDLAQALEICERGRLASARVADAAYLFPFLVTGTRAFFAAGDPAGAERWVADVSAALRHRSIPGTLPAIDHAEGLLALHAGHTSRARELLARAQAAWDARDRVWEGLGAAIDLAQAQLRAGRPMEAARLAAEAATRARAIGALPIAARADDAVRTARSRDPGDEPWSPLTARELEVARLVAGGSTNAEIAASLGVSPRTVGAHLEHIFAKLGVNRRAEIATWVATLGSAGDSAPREAPTRR